MTIFIACASVLMKQLKLQTAASVLILSAGIIISSVIIGWLVKGVMNELSARKSGGAKNI